MNQQVPVRTLRGLRENNCVISVEGGTGSRAGTEKFIRTTIRNIWRALLAKEIIRVFDNIRALIEI